MSDAVGFVEIDGQSVELLPARTVMSMFSAGGVGGGRGGNGGVGGEGGVGRGGLGINALNINAFGDQTNSAGDGTGGAGGSAAGGAGGSVSGRQFAAVPLDDDVRCRWPGRGGFDAATSPVIIRLRRVSAGGGCNVRLSVSPVGF